MSEDLKRISVVPDPFPAHPARFSPYKPQSPAPRHEVGVWQYMNRTTAVGCRCGLAWEQQWRAQTGRTQAIATRRARQHVRSARSRLARP